MAKKLKIHWRKWHSTFCTFCCFGVLVLFSGGFLIFFLIFEHIYCLYRIVYPILFQMFKMIMFMCFMSSYIILIKLCVFIFFYFFLFFVLDFMTVLTSLLVKLTFLRMTIITAYLGLLSWSLQKYYIKILTKQQPKSNE